PGIDVVVGGSALAGEILAAEDHGARPGSIAHDVVHHAVHDEGVAGVDDPQRFVPGASRLCLRENVAVVVDDLLNPVRLGAVAAGGKYRKEIGRASGRERM